MKQGLTLTELAAELERQLQSKRDFVAPTERLHVLVGGERGGQPLMTLAGVGTYPIQPYAHSQIAQHLGIPMTYYDRMRQEAPQLLADNANHWFAHHPAKRMLRTLDGHLRAYVSDRYRPLDNYDLVEAVLPVLLDDAQVRVESSAITETRMYIKVVTERLTAEIVPGDVVQAGLVVTNSEVGAGSVKVEPLLYRLICKNGAISQDVSMRKHHVGRGQAGDDAIREFLRDETRALDDRAFWAKVQDVVRGALNEVMFERLVRPWKDAAGQPISGDPVQVVEVTAKRCQR
jgi:hypothetical protein